MLELKNVSWALPGGAAILKDVSFTAPTGELTVITGPNGGGKTSIAKLIAGLIRQDSGSILLDGQDISELSITERARAGVAYAFQQPVRFKGITVSELIKLAAGDDVGEDCCCEVLGQVGLCARDYIDRDVDAGLSGGESKRIEIASVLARKDTKVIIFDEPEAGIDLWSFTSLIEVFGRLKQRKKETLIVISHQERILSIADNIIVIADGAVRSQGNTGEVLPELLGTEKQALCPRGKDR